MTQSVVRLGLYMSGGAETLRAVKGHLRIEREGEPTRDFPLENLESVVVGQRARLTSAAAGLLRRRGIPVSFLDWSGRLEARLEPHPSRNALLRRAQILAAEDDVRRLEMARAFVLAKLRNQRVFLLRVQRRRGLALDGAVRGLTMAAQQAASASSVAVLLGHEGQGARAYFGAWPALLSDSPFVWQGRRKRPAPDPVNALLSFGYALMSARCADAASIAGLDPYVGFLHSERQGRAELALDLVEEFRTPIIDSLVLAMIGRGQVQPGDFEMQSDGACRLNRAVRRAFFESFARKLQTVLIHPATGRRHALGQFPILQARLIGQTCAGRLSEYVPYTWR